MNVLLPISIIPPIPYIAAALQSQKATIDFGEYYIHQTIRNRYHIAGPNGVMVLTINVKSQKGLKIPTGEIEIDYSKAWQRLHLRTIEAAYRSAPFYGHYIAYLEPLLTGNETTLGELFSKAWPLWMKLLKISPNYSFSPKYLEENAAADLRAKIKEPAWYDGKVYSPQYMQVFADRQGFIPRLSVLDLLFNEGPAASHNIGSWLE